MDTIQKYFAITKPGIIRGNVMTAAAGFLLASKGIVDWPVLFATLIGIAVIIASACVVNNYIDRDIDKKMDRTKKRALATGDIKAQDALVFALALEIAGFGILAWYTNFLTVLLGVVAYFSYVVLYTKSKRTTPYGTLIGTIPGAMSLTAGYTAVTSQFDAGAVILFLIMVAWQMPHFYSIAIYRLKDYKSAGIPVLPAVRGVKRTKRSIIGYIILYLIAASLLYLYEYTGITYLIVMSIVGLIWLIKAIGGLKAKDNTKWAKQLFLFSLIVLLVFSFMISIETWVP